MLLASAGPAQSQAHAQPMPLIPAPAMVRASPALWEIRDADTTIYLFGTFHTLDGRTVWFDHKVREAFDASGELVLETIIPADMSAANEQATEAGPDGKRRLKPFIAQTRTVMNESKSIGMSVDNGADMVLRRVAEGLGKPVSGLERFEDQIKTLSNIPAPPPAAAAAAKAAPSAIVTVNDLLGAWRAGDTAAFSTMLAGFEAKSPVAYRMLIADRNARWGQWIADRLDQPGTVFVAVGTGHLAGKHSVQQWLAGRGIATARVS
ncbi:MAG: TraB/GumN family protein [Pseudomonadota bacterium]|nr:TraB/GumN family protein [Pseudomonadota bacterium]